MNNSEFVDWVIGEVWGRPDMLQTHFAGDWLQTLNSGSRSMGENRVPFGRREFVEHFMTMVQEWNVVEGKRLAMLNREVKDHVEVAVM